MTVRQLVLIIYIIVLIKISEGIFIIIYNSIMSIHAGTYAIILQVAQWYFSVFLRGGGEVLSCYGTCVGHCDNVILIIILHLFKK